MTKVELKCPKCNHVNMVEICRGGKYYSEFCSNCKTYIGFTVQQVIVTDEVWDYDDMVNKK